MTRAGGGTSVRIRTAGPLRGRLRARSRGSVAPMYPGAQQASNSSPMTPTIAASASVRGRRRMNATEIRTMNDFTCAFIHPQPPQR